MKKENNLLLDLVWAQSTVRDFLLILVGSWVIALFAQLEIPFYPVPVTGQTLAVLLVGALLGRKLGVATVVAYLIQGGVGLPFFAGGAAGLAVLVGPTAGYLFGFVLAAGATGWLRDLGWDKEFKYALAAMLIGNLFIYLLGIPWLAQFTGWENVLTFGFYPFISGDILKAFIAALLLPLGWKFLGKRGEQS